ncbi:MAG: cytochrome c biogenesis protein CcsA [Magnetococcales bacterium]|nr:cytochrome c biogenesis protein CcsA [Magnetococcales bacterium]
MEDWRWLLAAILYSVAALLLAGQLSRVGREAVLWPARLAWWLTLTGWLLQSSQVAQIVMTHGGQVAVNLVASLELAALVMGLLVLIGWHPKHQHNRLVAMVLLGLIVAFLFTAYLIPGGEGVFRQLVDPWLKVHFVLSILAYGLFTIAVVLALLDHAQQRALRQKQAGRLTEALPSLEQLEEDLFTMVRLAFVALTLSIGTGAIFLHNHSGAYLVFNHKIVFSWVTWLVFAALLLGHRLRGWRGRQAVRLTLWGYAFLVLAYLGVKFVYEFILHRNS